LGLRRRVSLTGSKAYLDTTVLCDALLKQDAKGAAARSAISSYQETILPVYAIKEFKAGPLNYWIWLHNKLVLTKSLLGTLSAIDALIGFQTNRVRTAQQALVSVMRPLKMTSMNDREGADIYRLAVARIILSAWNKRRRLTSKVADELPCYAESAPILAPRTGLFENPGMNCKLYGTDECCMAKALKGRTQDLEALLKAIQGLNRREDVNRRAVLHKLKNTPKRPMDASDCRRLGDAVFALYAPTDAVILTTNINDHAPLANALGKHVIAP
jgi:hypothetical protein